MFLLSLQPLLDFLLGAAPTTPPSDLKFDVPNPIPEIRRIPSLAAGIAKPDPRKGCVIGWQKPSRLPSQTEPLDMDGLGEHIYGGPSHFYQVSFDAIGHLYTKYGGIIDIAHVRDHADIARYAASRVVSLFKTGGTIDFGEDTDQFRSLSGLSTGKRLVTIKKQIADPTAFQAAAIGAAISYDIAMWHEIATYKTWQDYSAFSPEDNYSNLLGAYVGFLACLTQDRDYILAVAAALQRTLRLLLPQPRAVTKSAVEFLLGKWYHYGEDTSTFPDVYLFLDKRHMATGYNEDVINHLTPTFVVTPWVVTQVPQPLPQELREALVTDPPSGYVVSIHVPRVDERGTPLRNFYSLTIQKPGNADKTVFDNINIDAGLDSTQFGKVVEAIRHRFRSANPNADAPAP